MRSTSATYLKHTAKALVFRYPLQYANKRCNLNATREHIEPDSRRRKLKNHIFIYSRSIYKLSFVRFVCSSLVFRIQKKTCSLFAHVQALQAR